MVTKQLYKIYLTSTGVTTDTRNIAAGNIFFALKGEKFNGNKLAAEAIEKGAAYAVVDEIMPPEWKIKYGEKLILVENVLEEFQNLAGYHRNQFKCAVLAITGSNGKTTTKELVAAVLSKKYKTYATKGNLNNHIGIPITLLSIKPDAEIIIIEMGANHQGEIAGYCEYVKPGYGLITNIGLAHTEGFGGFEGVVKGKTELYRYVHANGGKVFVNNDDELLIAQLGKAGFDISDKNSVFTYGQSPAAFCQGNISKDADFLKIAVNEDGGIATIQSNLTGEYNFANVMSAVCTGRYFGVELSAVKAAIEAYVPSNNRSQKIAYGSNTIILDAYNANPSSMSAALQNFSGISAAHKAVILGEMMELDGLSKGEHEKIAEMVKQMPLDKKVFVGAGFAFTKNIEGFLHFDTTSELKLWFKQQHFAHFYILVKGSRKNELEKIFED